mmetsp:Transcript_27182/g.41645  ORF Transcript_27182/g.41645 Transcript_27182/m.41645 type:complete len:231 (+) Transcript_27182:802-1494(+)
MLLLLRNNGESPGIQLRQDVILKWTSHVFDKICRGISQDDRNILYRGFQVNEALLTNITAKFHNLLQYFHRIDSVLIKACCVICWKSKIMNRITLSSHNWILRSTSVRCFSIGRLHFTKMLVEILSDERSDRSHDSRDIEQDIIENLQSSFGIRIISLRALETVTIETNIPVGKLVNKSDQFRHNSVKSVGLHFFMNKFDKSLSCCRDPYISRISSCANFFCRWDEFVSA